jgi:outer membrane protein insertion porin family
MALDHAWHFVRGRDAGVRDRGTQSVRFAFFFVSEGLWGAGRLYRFDALDLYRQFNTAGRRGDRPSNRGAGGRGSHVRNRVRRAWQSKSSCARGPGVAWLCLVASLFASFAAFAQQSQPNTYAGFEGQAVSSVEMATPANVDRDAIRKLIKQEAGKPFSLADVRESAAALQQTHLFTQVQVNVEPEPSGLRILFILQPAEYVGVLSFPGTGTRFAYTELLQAANIPEQSPFFLRLQEQTKNGLLTFFHKRGYFAAQIQPEIQRDDAHRIVNLIFHCTMEEQARVRNITFEGLSEQQSASLRVSLRGIWAKLKRVSLKPGQKYSEPSVTKSIDFIRQRLRKDDQLAPEVRLASADYDASSNLVDVKFHVTPPVKVTVRISGAKVSKGTMHRLIPIYEEDAVDQDLVDEGQRNLESYFQTKGYFDATVDSHVDKRDGMVNVVYEVSRGAKHEVKGVYFDGNHYFTDKQLQPHVTIKKGFLFLHGDYSEQALRKSVDALTTIYKDAGFADVSIRPKVEDFKPEVYVTFEIAGGTQNTVASLQVLNNKTQPLAKLTRKHPLVLKPGKPYSPRLLEADRSQLLAAYLDLGYLNVSFRSAVSPVPGDPHKMDVTYTIDEGPQAFVSDVVLLGEKHTKPQFMQKIYGTQIKPDQPLSETKFLQSQSDLYDLGVFDWASIKPLRPIVDQTQELVLVKVHESPLNSMDIGGGLEVIPRSGNVPANSVVVPGLPPISLGNKFTVSQKSYIGPLFTFDFTRHDIRGRAESATFGTVLSRLDQRVFFTYTGPHLHGSSWSSLLSFSAERTTENPIYTAELGSASFQVEKALNKKRTANLIFRYSFQRTNLYNIIIPDLVLPQDQHVRFSTFEVEYVRDTRDNPLDAHRGVFQSFDFGVTPTAFGSSANFVRFLGQTSFYKQVKPWLVWANDFRLGLAKPFSGSEVPLSERFFTGGADSLRGFPINGAGPQRPVPVCSNPADQSTCTLISVPEGGDMLFIFNSEARFPLPFREGLGAVLFYDGGNVYSNINLRQFADNFTHSVGVGIRYKTPVGPIRFDVGYRITTVPGVGTTQYFVSLGQSF